MNTVDAPYFDELLAEFPVLETEQLLLNRIEAETIEDNHESRRMLERLDFVCEGIRGKYSLEDDGKFHGNAIYGLLRSETNYPPCNISL